MFLLFEVQIYVFPAYRPRNQWLYSKKHIKSVGKTAPDTQRHAELRKPRVIQGFTKILLNQETVQKGRIRLGLHSATDYFMAKDNRKKSHRHTACHIKAEHGIMATTQQGYGLIGKRRESRHAPTQPDNEQQAQMIWQTASDKLCRKDTYQQTTERVNGKSAPRKSRCANMGSGHAPKQPAQDTAHATACKHQKALFKHITCFDYPTRRVSYKPPLYVPHERHGRKGNGTTARKHGTNLRTRPKAGKFSADNPPLPAATFVPFHKIKGTVQQEPPDTLIKAPFTLL